MDTSRRSLTARLLNVLRVYRGHALFSIKRADKIPSIQARIPLSFQRVNRENLADSLAFRSGEIISVFQRYLEREDLGLFAYYQGSAVAHGWMVINRGASPMTANGYFPLCPREALVHFCNVDERYRGNGIYQALLCELYRTAFAEEPVNQIYIDTERSNVASAKAIGRTALFVENQHYLKFGSRYIALSWLK